MQSAPKEERKKEKVCSSTFLCSNVTQLWQNFPIIYTSNVLKSKDVRWLCQNFPIIYASKL